MKLTKDKLSLKGPHTLKNEYKESLKLNETQRNIIVGTLLGDAHLEPRGQKTVYRYYFCQKEAQCVYVNHVYSYFIDWCSKGPKVEISGENRMHVSLRTKFVYFRTCTHPAFYFYANQFYIKENDSPRKVIPKLLHKWLNPQVLAFWFMDDGSKDNYGYILNTQCYSFAEQEVLADALGRKFKFEVNIHKDRDNYRLYITAKSRDSFTQIVRPFIIPSFEYKLFK